MLGQAKLFKSFIQGGFECSTHRRNDGKRLDLISSTFHDQNSDQDYSVLKKHGIYTVRDGIRWHLIETYPGYYDWSSFLPMLKAAIRNKTQVIWDLCHYGWPDDIDIWKPEFVTRFANFATAVAKLIKNETEDVTFYSPINEISFWAWAGGDVGYFNPTSHQRGFELKHQLIRATIAAIEAIRIVDPSARFIQAEPLINVLPNSNGYTESEIYNESQFQAFDMLSGKIWPGLGGREELLDIIGINYYPYNQWIWHGTTINRYDPNYIPLSILLEKVYKRYQKPLFIAETGAEGSEREKWLNYIGNEVFKTMCVGVLIEGICLYPILDYPGWDDDRHCQTGLLGLADIHGFRNIYAPLAREIKQQQLIFNDYCK